MKKPNNQEERLVQALVVACLLILVLFSTLIAYVILDISGVKKEQLNFARMLQHIQLVPGEDGLKGVDGQSIVGPQGVQGPKGDTGLTGNNGNNGATVVGPTGAQGAQGEKGDQGVQGEPGPPGRTVFTRTNPITGQGECRYAGDSGWMPESECQ